MEMKLNVKSTKRKADSAAYAFYRVAQAKCLELGGGGGVSGVLGVKNKTVHGMTGIPI